ncbi:MAG: glycosyltransferase [Bacteroidota bacterium]|nr:glycosyltransferase [Bacteroidota bacterium]
MDENFDLTIIIPVFNEEKNLSRVETEMLSYSHKSKLKVKFLFVNDGSTDSSQQMIEAICNKNPNFNYLEFGKNEGLSTALKAGIDATTTQWVGYIDSDLQTTPDDFNLLIDFADNYELVTGIRVDRKDKIIKRISSKIANGIRKSMTHDGVDDTGCPLKIMKTDAARNIPFFKGMHRFLPALILLQGGKVKQIPVRHFPRIAGEAKYHLMNRLVGPFVDLLAYKWMEKKYINYTIKKKA